MALQTTNGNFNSGNENAINVAGNHITYNTAGEEINQKVASIAERLQVDHDEKFGKIVTSCFHCRVFTAIAGDKVHDWLSAPKVSENYTAATDLHLEGTSSWFIDGDEFSDWKKSPEHFLGVYGARESGDDSSPRTCSSYIIDKVEQLCESQSLSGYAYFFFDKRNSDPGLLRFENFLRSLLSQLAYRSGGIPGALKDLYRARGSGREKPSAKSLRQTLQRVIAGFDLVYIMIDSLDECGDWDELLQWIKDMAGQTDLKLHLLFTSRPEPTIVENLGFISRLRQVSMEAASNKSDIWRYLDVELSLVPSWNEEIRSLIRSELAGHADGMFRWVTLHIQQLKYCLTLTDVEEQLKQLPKNLEDSYSRILVETKPSQCLKLRHILHWLAFSARALKLREIAEVVSVDFEAEHGPTYNPKCRFGNPTAVLTVCSGLVTETDGIVKLAHLSVKEFLMSNNIKAGAIAFFGINERVSNSAIAQTCLAYLLNFNEEGSISKRNIDSFPLAMYAAEHWVPHLLTSEDDTPPLHNMLLRLFSLPRSDALVNWVQMWDIDEVESWQRTTFQKADSEIAQPIYYACAVGQIKIVEHLLRDGADPNESGFYGTPLQVALVYNERKIAKLLLDWNADVTIQAGKYGTALNVASMSGKLKLRSPRQPDVAISQDIIPDCSDGAASIEIVNMLLDRGADPNAHAGSNIPLVSAAGFGSLIEIVTLLLDRGADINAQGDDGPALQQASGNGRLDVVALLLDRGADVKVRGVHSTALQRASGDGHLEIVTLLLDRGADINAQGDDGPALQRASGNGRLDVVALLLDRGADIKVRGVHSTALQRASGNGHLEIVTLLLDRGADINAQGYHGTALQQAVSNGYADIVTLLLERGADINAWHGDGGHDALRKASSRGYLETVTALLDHGADINGKVSHSYLDTATQVTDRDCNALQVASGYGHLEIVTALLDHGADINAGGRGGTALQRASSCGHLKIVTALLDHGADINAQGHKGSTALRRATGEGHFAIVTLLLDRGADINARGYWGTALDQALHRDHLEIATLLLDREADPNAGDGGTALWRASHHADLKVVTLLLDRGVDVNGQEGRIGSQALERASIQCHENLMDLQWELRADANALNHEEIASLMASAKGHLEVVNLLLDRGVEAVTEELTDHMRTTAEAAIRALRECSAKSREEREFSNMWKGVVGAQAVLRLFLGCSDPDLLEDEQSLMEEDVMEELT
ncbi:hypothetical protein HWV62_11848 [Athelia sp. TMB]|nr:hypothetical protein HWV62_11848 [Athelia sp. TMB]